MKAFIDVEEARRRQNHKAKVFGASETKREGETDKTQ